MGHNQIDIFCTDHLLSKEVWRKHSLCQHCQPEQHCVLGDAIVAAEYTCAVLLLILHVNIGAPHRRPKPPQHQRQPRQDRRCRLRIKLRRRKRRWNKPTRSRTARPPRCSWRRLRHWKHSRSRRCMAINSSYDVRMCVGVCFHGQRAMGCHIECDATVPLHHGRDAEVCQRAVGGHTPPGFQHVIKHTGSPQCLMHIANADR